MSFDIAYIVSHGFASRMVTQTDLLGKLTRKGLKVALITPDKKDPNLTKYCEDHGVTLFEFDQRGKFSNENYMFKRKYYLENIKENPALWEKHVTATKYNKSRHPLRRIRPYYYGFVYRMVEQFPQIRSRFIRNEVKYLISKGADKLLKQINPKKLIATYPVNFNEATLLHQAKKIDGIETWIHLLSWDNITSKGRFPESAEKYISWGPIMTEELESFYGATSNDIFECGVAHFDIHSRLRNEDDITYLEHLGINTNQPYLMFAMSSPRFAPGEIEILEQMADWVSKGELGNVQLVVRPHPQNVEGIMADKTWLPRLEKLGERKGVFVSYPMLSKSKLNWSMQEKDMLNLATLIANSSVVMNSGSTVAIDGLMHRKPIIITSFDGERNETYWRSALRLIDYTHLKKLVSYDGVDVVKSYDQLKICIIQYLENPEHKMDLRMKTLKMECADIDGNATQNIVEVLTTN